MPPFCWQQKRQGYSWCFVVAVYRLTLKAPKKDYIIVLVMQMAQVTQVVHPQRWRRDKPVLRRKHYINQRQSTFGTVNIKHYIPADGQRHTAPSPLTEGQKNHYLLFM